MADSNNEKKEPIIIDNTSNVITWLEKGLKLIKEYVKENQISIAILALPKTEVSDIVSILSECGIKGLWNFSSAEINVGNEIAVENVHMSDSLMTLSYKIKQEEK